MNFVDPSGLAIWLACEWWSWFVEYPDGSLGEEVGPRFLRCWIIILTGLTYQAGNPDRYEVEFLGGGYTDLTPKTDKENNAQRLAECVKAKTDLVINESATDVDLNSDLTEDSVVGTIGMIGGGLTLAGGLVTGGTAAPVVGGVAFVASIVATPVSVYLSYKRARDKVQRFANNALKECAKELGITLTNGKGGGERK